MKSAKKSKTDTEADETKINYRNGILRHYIISYKLYFSIIKYEFF